PRYRPALACHLDGAGGDRGRRSRPDGRGPRAAGGCALGRGPIADPASLRPPGRAGGRGRVGAEANGRSGVMRVGIVGLGLIGGSLGLALRRLGESVEVRGVAHHPNGVVAAQQRGAVDRASTDLRDLADCDLVVVATPINQIRPVFEGLAGVVRRATIVTDVASVKRPVLEWARCLPEPSQFLGGHPVAGKERSGLSESDATLFRGETWIFTPVDGQELTPFDEWFRLVRGMGARPKILSAEAHDRQMAFLSHLAFTISTAYAQTVRPVADSELGGPGYRGMVRLAEGDASLYEDIAATNRGPLVEAIDSFTDVLRDYRERIDRGDRVGDLFRRGVHATR
ncbi:MAG: prephenate dehydrogenase, partial [Chloroflexi bacterium]